MPLVQTEGIFEPVQRQSVSDAVFVRLRDQIVSGGLEPGSALPAERVLCEALGVNRGAVREALRRLEQARLVSVRHGGTSRVLDFRQSAGLDLLADLVLTPGGELDPAIIRSIVEMRSVIAPDAARICAERHGAEVGRALEPIVQAMEQAQGDVERLQVLSIAFWTEILTACENLAYRLAYNTLRRVVDRASELLRTLQADELRAVDAYRALAAAIAGGDGRQSRKRARAIVRRGEESMLAALERIDAAGGRES